MSILITALLTIWMIVALLMILVILMQRPKSEGLGAAFGGGVTENIFGAQTTNVLVKFTGYLAAIFFAITFALSILYAKQASGKSALRQELLKSQAAPQSSAAPSASVTDATSPVPSGSPAPAAPAAGVAPPATAPVAPSVAPATKPAASPPEQRKP